MDEDEMQEDEVVQNADGPEDSEAEEGEEEDEGEEEMEVEDLGDDEPIPIDIEEEHVSIPLIPPISEIVSLSRRIVKSANAAVEVLDDDEDSEAIAKTSRTASTTGSARRQLVSPVTSSIPVNSAVKTVRPATKRTRTSSISDNSPDPTPSRPSATREVQAYRSEIQTSTTSGEITLSFSLPRLKARYAANIRRRKDVESNGTSGAYAQLSRSGVTAEAGISNRDTHSAEEALARVISKDDFGSMEILGQFNKGFIIARLRKNGMDDLFCVDQHASDEKFNFETLQRTTHIRAQALIK